MNAAVTMPWGRAEATSTAKRADGQSRTPSGRGLPVSCNRPELELRIFPVRDVQLGQESAWERGVLTVDAHKLRARLIAESGLRRVGIAIARPGESVRIVNVLDAIEPRVKPAGGGQSFPGFLGPFDGTVGRGVTHALMGSAVLVCGDIPGQVASQIVSEAIVDMSGPGATYCPFSNTCNIVLTCDFFDDQGPIKRAQVARFAGLLAARLIAEATLDCVPEDTRNYDFGRWEGNAGHEVPRIVYICPGMILSDLHQTFLGGTPLTTTPTVVPPTQLLDGVLVSGNYDIGATRNPTYMYQRCPIVEDLLERQRSREVAFPGVVVSMCLIDGHGGKQRSANLAAQAAHLLGADGAVISIEECGHAYADLMLTCQACEDAGIKTVLVMAESAGSTGEKPASIAFAEAADAVVSVGNMDEVISLPAMDTALGGMWFRGRWMLEQMASEAVDTPLVNVFAATCQMGPCRLRAEER